MLFIQQQQSHDPQFVLVYDNLAYCARRNREYITRFAPEAKINLLTFKEQGSPWDYLQGKEHISGAGGAGIKSVRSSRREGTCPRTELPAWPTAGRQQEPLLGAWRFCYQTCGEMERPYLKSMTLFLSMIFSC